MARFITLAGRKQVGKDTSARYIKNMVESARPGTKVHIVHFADALKEACVAVFGIPRSDMETETGKQKPTEILWPSANAEGWHAYTSDSAKVFNDLNPSAGSPMTVREILQFVGTELFRTQIDPDLWVKSVFRRQYGENDIVVVADCRFPNEASYAKERGLLIEVLRDTGSVGDKHASEMALEGYLGYDAYVRNDSSFENLRSQLHVILSNHSFLA